MYKCGFQPWKERARASMHRTVWVRGRRARSERRFVTSVFGVDVSFAEVRDEEYKVEGV
jgi:hypothetical protein